MGKKGASTVLIVVIVVIAVAGLFFLGLKIANDKSEESNQNEELENSIDDTEASLNCIDARGINVRGITKEGPETYSVTLEQGAESNPADGIKIKVQNPETGGNYSGGDVEINLEALDIETINSRFEEANFEKGETVNVIIEPYTLGDSGQKHRCSASISENLEII